MAELSARRFWHARPTVLARIASFLQNRIPEIIDVTVEDPIMLTEDDHGRDYNYVHVDLHDDHELHPTSTHTGTKPKDSHTRTALNIALV